MHKVIVIGGGAAGMMAAYTSSLQGNSVILLEKNEKLGKKVYITGKGRCNVTNNCDVNSYLENVVSNPKFMYGAIHNLTPSDLIYFFEENGLKLKTERGNRVFPQSDKASDVTNCFIKLLEKAKVSIKLNQKVLYCNKIGQKFQVVTQSEKFDADSIIICTGGISYPLTGSDGDGYNFAKSFGHSIIDTKPALVGINLKEDFCKELQGLSLKNVVLTVKNHEKTLFSQLGEMIFTHFGISGPLVLTASALINRINLEQIKFFIDFKPGMDYDILDKRLVRELTNFNLKSIENALKTLLPSTIVKLILRRANVGYNKKCAEINVQERSNIVKTLKNFHLTPKSLRSIEEAIVTAGGVNVKDVNPKTMESKIISGLFFAGEILDVDCFTGGFNMQTAFSTGYTAGLNS